MKFYFFVSRDQLTMPFLLALDEENAPFSVVMTPIPPVDVVAATREWDARISRRRDAVKYPAERVYIQVYVLVMSTIGA